MSQTHNALLRVLRSEADPTRLRQVVGNLLGNAVKFTAKGVVVLRAEEGAAPPGDSRRWMRVTVEDTGIGIDEHAQKRLYERFVQADPTMTRRYGGSGLGLAICKHLVERMGASGLSRNIREVRAKELRCLCILLVSSKSIFPILS